MKNYMKELKEHYAKEKPSEGKGVVEALCPNSGKLVEQLKNVQHADIKEQWTIVIPNLTTKEVAGHLRDYVFVTDEIKGAKVGDQVEVPYVKDFDFTHVTIGSAFSGVSGLVGTKTTSIKEAGEYSDIAYEDIEKINQNLLDELNRTFAHAAVRAEDWELLKLLNARETASFGGTAGLTGPRIKAGATTVFEPRWIADAIGALILAGKEVHPGDCVLAISPTCYTRLLRELSTTTATAVAYARGDIITKGMIEDWLGVRILVMGKPPRNASPASTTYEAAFLMRAKRCVGLAPKRDILIETDRIIKTRKLTITGSHTFGVIMLDPLEAVMITSGQKQLSGS